MEDTNLQNQEDQIDSRQYVGFVISPQCPLSASERL